MPKFLERITAQEFSAASSAAIDASVDGDSNARIQIDAGGKITWGPGNASGDATLYRSAANVLKTDDTFEAALGVITLATDGAPSTALANGALAVDTTNDTFYFRSSGSWQEVSGGGASLTVSDTAPGSPEAGNLWFESDTGRTLVYYADGSSNQWVEVGVASASGASGTDGKIQFSESDSLTSDTLLHWDNTNNRLGIGTASPSYSLDVTGTARVTGVITASGGVTGALTGNADTATALANARTIGGTSFDGTANIAVALAATATALATARTIGGVSFDGTANINLPGVNAAGNQNTSGTAATVTGAAQSAITSVGTLTGLTLSGDLTVNGGDIAAAIGLNDTKGLTLTYSSEVKAGLLLNPNSGEVRIGALNSTGDYFVTFYADNAEAVRVTAAGSVGIADTTIHSYTTWGTPKLQVNAPVHIKNWTGTPSSSTELLDWPHSLLHITTKSNYAWARLQSWGYSNDAPYNTSFDTMWNLGILQNSTLDQTVSNSGTDLKFAGPGAFAIRCGGDERFKITNTGLVGIGTTTPTAPLHLFGAGDGVDQIKISSTGGTVAEYGFLGANASTNAMRYGYWTGSGYGNHLFEGNVGIGTASPLYLLHVNGYARTGNLRVISSSEGWSEGIRIVTAAGSWGGIRFKRTDAATAETGNWYMGYQNNSTHDLAFGCYNGSAQDDNILYLKNSNGFVGIRNAAPVLPLDVAGGGADDQGAMIRRRLMVRHIDGKSWNDAGLANSGALYFNYARSTACYINWTGSGSTYVREEALTGSTMIMTGGKIGYSTSRAALKDNVRDLTGAVDLVKQMRPVRFNFKPSAIGDGTNEMVAYDERVGFIAEEMADISHELAVWEWFDEDGKPLMVDPEMNEDGTGGSYLDGPPQPPLEEAEPIGWESGAVASVTVAALKELIARVEALEAA